MTYAEAQAKAVNWFTKMTRQAKFKEQGGEVVNAATFTVGNALTAYFKEKERPGAKGAKGLDIAKQSAAAWIIPILGNVSLTKLSKKNVQDWLDFVATSGRRIGGKTGAHPKTAEEKRKRRDTANRILSILKAALTFAYNENDGLAEELNPCWQRVKPYKETAKARPRFLKDEEETRLINACPPDFKELVMAALETGCRYGELSRLKVKDYDPEREIPTIYIAESKSGKPRYVDLGSERGISLFNELIAKKTSPDDLLFTHTIKCLKQRDKNNKPLTVVDARGHSNQKQLMEDACEKAGIEPIGFHGLRHTYASLLIRGGANLSHVAAQLGHGDTRMVEKYYGHLAPDDKARAIQAAMTGRGRLDAPKFQKLKIKKQKTS